MFKKSSFQVSLSDFKSNLFIFFSSSLPSSSFEDLTISIKSLPGTSSLTFIPFSFKIFSIVLPLIFVSLIKSVTSPSIFLILKLSPSFSKSLESNSSITSKKGLFFSNLSLAPSSNVGFSWSTIDLTPKEEEEESHD